MIHRRRKDEIILLILHLQQSDKYLGTLSPCKWARSTLRRFLMEIVNDHIEKQNSV